MLLTLPQLEVAVKSKERVNDGIDFGVESSGIRLGASAHTTIFAVFAELAQGKPAGRPSMAL
jgi:hypothetical protein